MGVRCGPVLRAEKRMRPLVDAPLGGRQPPPASLSRARQCQSIQRVMSLIHRWNLLAYLICCQVSRLRTIQPFPYCGRSFFFFNYFSLSVAVFGTLQSALQMPCLSSEHGGKSSGVRLPGGRVHRGAFRRGPGGYHCVCGESKGMLSRFVRLCARQ